MRRVLGEAVAHLAGVTEARLAVHVAGPLWYRTDQTGGWVAEWSPAYAAVCLAPDQPYTYNGPDGTPWLAAAAGDDSAPGAVTVLLGFAAQAAASRAAVVAAFPFTLARLRADSQIPSEAGGLSGWLAAEHPWLPPVRCLLDAGGALVRGVGLGPGWTGRTILPLLSPESRPRVEEALAADSAPYGTEPVRVVWLAESGGTAGSLAELLPCPENDGRWLLTVCAHAAGPATPVRRNDLGLCLDRRAQEAGRREALIPVVIIDLDQFAHVNDWLGFDAGDRILAEVECRLSAVTGYGACARLGGDEFACILTPSPSAPAALQDARALLRVFAAPLEIGGETLRLTASAGVSLYPAHATCLEPLLLGAASALRRAKRRGKNRVEMLARPAAGARGERGRIASSLRAQLVESEFRLRFQPQVGFDGTLVGFEALAEWLHPEFGVIPPGRFIPVAEECGRITELGAVLLSIAALQAAQWRQRYGFGGRLAVNVSALQFDRPDFADHVAAALGQAQLPGHCLELEVTETSVISDIRLAQQACARLRGLGVSICLDDFGVGFASLRLVQDLPLDALKLDRSFVRDLVHSPSTLSLVEAVVHLAHGRGARLVAEGVETPEELRRLAGTGCDAVQGYLICPPLDAEAATLLLAEHRHWGNLRLSRGHSAGQ